MKSIYVWAYCSAGRLPLVKFCPIGGRTASYLRRHEMMASALRLSQQSPLACLMKERRDCVATFRHRCPAGESGKDVIRLTVDRPGRRGRSWQPKEATLLHGRQPDTRSSALACPLGRALVRFCGDDKTLNWGQSLRKPVYKV